MTLQKKIKIIFNALILTVFIGCIIWAMFDKWESRMRAEQLQFLTGQQSIWAEEDAKKAIAAQQKIIDEERTHSNELVDAWGGPVKAAVKNPALDIRNMLQETAVACAPANTLVSVTVDRFMDFNIDLILPEPIALSRLAKISKQFLKYTFPYVHNVRFIQGDEVLAYLDDAAIESVTNWNTISAERLGGMLAAGLSGQTEWVAAATNDDNAVQPVQDLAPDQVKFNEAEGMFKKHFNDHVHALNEIVGNLDHVSRLNSIQNKDEFQSRIVWLDELVSHLAAERKFFMNQSADMENLLRGQGLDPLLIDIVKRNTKARNESESPILTNLFDAVSAYCEADRAFLVSMKSQWGDWQAEPNSDMIQFTTPEARAAYKTGMDSIERSGGLVQRAFQAWANYKQSQ
jgi:hypothetical protein